MKTDYIAHSPSTPEPHQSVPERADTPEKPSATFFAALQFLSETQDMSRVPNVSDSRPTVQGTHLDPQLLEVISLLTLPLAIISTPVLTPVHGSMTIHDKVITGPQRNKKNKNNAVVVDTTKCIQSERTVFYTEIRHLLILFCF